MRQHTAEADAKHNETLRRERLKPHKRPPLRDRALEVLSRSTMWIPVRAIAARLSVTRSTATGALIALRDVEGLVESRSALDDVADSEASFEWRRKKPAAP